ncbi:hypothetical protein ACLBYN_52715, partial [Pseudomonas aeruginosa]
MAVPGMGSPSVSCADFFTAGRLGNLSAGCLFFGESSGYSFRGQGDGSLARAPVLIKSNENDNNP